MKVNITRYIESFDKLLACGGYQENRGLTRLALTDEDKAARDMLVAWMEDANLTVKIDDMGNIYGIREGKDNQLPPIVIGSHLDTVQNGGKFDGIIGVLAGLEIIRSLNDMDISTLCPIVMCSWTNEEGTRFLPGMMGSGVIVGTFNKEECYSQKAVGSNITFEGELKRIGYCGEEENRINNMKAYLELHIEQGPILEEEGLSLGIVQGVKSMAWNEIVIKGEANHAGPLPMSMRKDALLAAAQIVTKVKEMIESYNGNTTVTFGKFEVEPNIPSIIPEKVTFTQDIRSEDSKIVEHGLEMVYEIVKNTCAKYKVDYEIKRIGHMEAVIFDDKIKHIIEESVIERGDKFNYLFSGAGHDAFQISNLYPVGMIFIKTVGGKSHCPEEDAHFADIEKGLNVLLDTVLKLSKEE
ncbi:M20 family metallo-hydrolase [Paenibacillus tuaregi]|uniref:M20 family metallo-hydrolase n=1 Tax=Paenibacillus tuaregi TaxID=1816681 RepID=UPI000A98B7FE|nr:M20 family metallo-hydrolase [Paenibacillus tuaregi]